jgi:uncharacterized protein (TIGR02996 family)
MSAALRYDIPNALYVCIRDEFPEIEFTPTSRWGGVRKARYECETFGLRLPDQVKTAWDLLSVMRGLGRSSVKSSAWTLEKKLAASLGVPIRADRMIPGEEEWLLAIAAEPENLGRWGAYADWLQERGTEDANCCGLLIVGWLGPVALKMKYGVPMMATPQGRRELKWLDRTG